MLQGPYRFSRSHISHQIFHIPNHRKQFQYTYIGNHDRIEYSNGLPMTALGIMALQLRIPNFKFTYNFIICDRLPDMEILFGIDIQKKISLSYAWHKEKNCCIQKDGRFLTYTWNCEQKLIIGIVKSTLKIPPRHSGIVPIMIKGHTIKGHMGYFISNHNSTK